MIAPTSETTIHKFVLSNGVRVLVEPVGHVRSAAIGLWCKTGSRHELDHEAGVTHLIEHMLFKGTDSRSAKQIAEEIEGKGGMLNAFTDKEHTCYYCRVLSDDALNGFDVLADMMTHSLIAPDELAREAGVVVEEIKRSEDEPSDHVHELHLQGRWGDHPLGKPIIGTRESVSGFRRDDLTAYMARRYRGENIVLAVAGQVDPNVMRTAAETILGGIEHGVEDAPLTRPSGLASRNELKKDVEQVHFCIGSDGVSLYDDDLYTMGVLDGVLGSGMSSRLFQEIREKRGLVYAIGSYSLSYTAGGAFTVYGGTSPTTWSEVHDLVIAELKRLTSEGVPDDELERTKKNICGHMVLALEGMSARMMRMARNELNFQRDIPIEESIAKVQAVSSEQIQALAERLFADELVSTTAIGPFAS